MQKIAVDAMGGDFAPESPLRGAVQSLQQSEDFVLVLYGNQGVIEKHLASMDFDRGRVQIVHASESIGMGDSPVEALKRKKDSSIIKMVVAAAHGEVDAVISAGNTGAFAAACQLKLRTLPGVIRPGIGVVIPSFHGPFVLCDAGANIQAKAQHLHQYGIMAGLYAQKVVGIEEPRVALLSVGEESEKGTTLIKQTQGLLREDDRVNFVGNVEGRQLFDGVCDVAVCDGFVGNLMLKFVEGVAEGFLKTIGAEVASEAPDSKVRQTLHDVLDRVRARHDYSEYGGAPLLGAGGVSIICHGRSNDRAIFNAIRVARKFLTLGLNDAIAERFGAASG
ncbi:MAG: phosphate acyltransferase PlsX [Phycisphaerae bacterium]